MTITNNTHFPSGPIKIIKGSCIYLQGNDIDTDRIIPARFLKCVSFEALGNQVFCDDRKDATELHPFDNEQYKGSSILIVDKNFGCGSSREHAPQALMRWGIRAIIGLSFAEIFYGNCLSIGIPCAIISEDNLKSLINTVNNSNKLKLTLDIQSEKLYTDANIWPLKIENAVSKMLISGDWDGISKLINEKDKINLTMNKLPYLNSFNI